MTETLAMAAAAQSCAVAFHTGVADVPSHACRLLRKAVQQGAQVLVLGPAPLLGKLDALLWTFDQDSFLPHMMLGQQTQADEGKGAEAAQTMARLSPLWLLARQPGLNEIRPVIVNLGLEVPAQAQRCEKIIEIVGNDPAQRQAGQERWRVYRSWGVTPQHHAYGDAA